jgi:isocitrate/isopropylmalate dehydrogenase
MLLRHLGEAEAADRIDAAVAELLRRGTVRTPDLGGAARTTEVGDALCALLAEGAAAARGRAVGEPVGVPA